MWLTQVDLLLPNETLNKKPDYQIDEEDLAKETEWIRVKHGAKKKKKKKEN
jgi:hypothetical protein